MGLWAPLVLQFSLLVGHGGTQVSCMHNKHPLSLYHLSLVLPRMGSLASPQLPGRVVEGLGSGTHPPPKVVLSPAPFTSLNSTMIVHKCFIVIRPLSTGHRRLKIVLETIHTSSRTFKKYYLGCMFWDMCMLGYVCVGMCVCVGACMYV